MKRFGHRIGGRPGTPQLLATVRLAAWGVVNRRIAKKQELKGQSKERKEARRVERFYKTDMKEEIKESDNPTRALRRETGKKRRRDGGEKGD